MCRGALEKLLERERERDYKKSVEKQEGDPDITKLQQTRKET